MRNDFLTSQTKYITASDENGHCFTIATGLTFFERLNQAMSEHYDGVVKVGIEAMAAIEIFRDKTSFTATIYHDGDEDGYELSIDLEQTWVY